MGIVKRPQLAKSIYAKVPWPTWEEFACLAFSRRATVVDATFYPAHRAARVALAEASYEAVLKAVRNAEIRLEK